MFYKLLGMLVWKGGKLFLRRKAASMSLAKPAVAGVAVVALIGGLLLLRRDSSS